MDLGYYVFEILIKEESEAPVDIDNIYGLVEFNLETCNSLEKWQLIDAAGKKRCSI
jgi:hypothetical protein